MQYEPRGFMFCNFLNHAGLASIQYKTFFHMCRLESISFDMESRSGSTFCLYDCLASGVIGMLTIGVHRKATVKFMMDALNFIQNQVSLFYFHNLHCSLGGCTSQESFHSPRDWAHRSKWKKGLNLNVRRRSACQGHQQSLREGCEGWRRRRWSKQRKNLVHVSASTNSHRTSSVETKQVDDILKKYKL